MPTTGAEALKNKDRTDSSRPDRTDSSVLERTNASDKEYSKNNIQEHVNVTGFINPSGADEDEEARVEFLTLEMLDVLGDRQSTGLYRRLARALPEDIIFRALAETKELSAAGRIRKSNGAYFTATEDAQRRGCRACGRAAQGRFCFWCGHRRGLW